MLKLRGTRRKLSFSVFALPLKIGTVSAATHLACHNHIHSHIQEKLSLQNHIHTGEKSQPNSRSTRKLSFSVFALPPQDWHCCNPPGPSQPNSHWRKVAPSQQPHSQWRKPALPQPHPQRRKFTATFTLEKSCPFATTFDSKLTFSHCHY